MKITYKVTLLTMLLFSTVYVMAKEHLDEIHIKNNYGLGLSCTLYWKDPHGAHTQQLQVVSVPTGHHDTFKAPLLGYGLERIVAGPSYDVYTLPAGYTPTTTDADGNTFFEVNKGSQYKNTLLYYADISKYKDENAYNAAQKTSSATVANAATPATSNTATPSTAAPATPATSNPAAPATT